MLAVSRLMPGSVSQCCSCCVTQFNTGWAQRDTNIYISLRIFPPRYYFTHCGTAHPLCSAFPKNWVTLSHKIFVTLLKKYLSPFPLEYWSPFPSEYKLQSDTVQCLQLCPAALLPPAGCWRQSVCLFCWPG